MRTKSKYVLQCNIIKNSPLLLDSLKSKLQITRVPVLTQIRKRKSYLLSCIKTRKYCTIKLHFSLTNLDPKYTYVKCVNVGEFRYLCAGDARQGYGHTNIMKLSEKLILSLRCYLKINGFFQENSKYIFFYNHYTLSVIYYLSESKK